MEKRLKTLWGCIMVLFFISTNLNAATYKPNEVIDDDYQVFISKTQEVNFKNAKQELVFFGDRFKFSENAKKLQKLKEKNGVDDKFYALTESEISPTKKYVGKALGAISTLGASLIVEALNPYVTKLKADKLYMLIYDYTDKSGKKSRVTAMFIADGFDDKKVIRTYLDNEIKGKLQ